MMRKKIKRAIDLFAGAGGTSTGLIQACKDAGYDVDLLAINHWDVAIATHSKNHPRVKHLCTGVDSVDPRQLVREGKIKPRIDILWASPECQHHSIARGGKPVNDQSRATAWCVLRWCEALYVETLMIENVKEFRSWGPIGANGRPLKSKRGQTFLAFIEALKSLGYRVEHRILNAADYGDPTSRERFFLIARRGNKPIKFPEPTHGKAAPVKNPSLFCDDLKRQPYRTAREIIDWSIPGESIFSRKRPLSEKTMARIFAGIRKYCGLEFIVPNFGEREGQQPRTHSVDAPLPAVTGHGAGALVQPFLVKIAHRQAKGDYAYPLDKPLTTITSQVEHALVEPFIVQLRNNQDAQSLDKPLSTIATSGGHHALCEPFFVPVNHGGGEDRTRSLDKPLPTVTTKGSIGLCQAFVLGQQSCAAPRDVDKPLPTIATDGAIALVQPFLMGVGGPRGTHSPRTIDEPMRTLLTRDHTALIQPFITRFQGNHKGRNDGDRRNHEIDAPLPTQDTSNRFGLVQPYLVKYNGTGGAMSVDEPLDTISTKDRFGLCVPHLGALLDIRFRMLQPHELAAAMSFPKTYVFTGNREQKVKQIGNAVGVNQARALVRAIL